MDFRASDEQQVLRRSIREFAEGEIRPHVMEWDEAQQFPMALLPRLAELWAEADRVRRRKGYRTSLATLRELVTAKGARGQFWDFHELIREIKRWQPSLPIIVCSKPRMRCTSSSRIWK